MRTCTLQVIRCHVEGLSRPLRLTVSGTCVGAPASRDVYHVTTSVRQRETKALPVPNHSANVTYNLRPVIDGAEHFSGPETLVVPPSSTRTYELTYQPLTMTTDGKKHTVSSHCSSVYVATAGADPGPSRRQRNFFEAILVRMGLNLVTVNRLG